MSRLIPLQLDGKGYTISVTPDAEKRKAALIADAAKIKVVSDNQQAEDARYCLKELNDLAVAVEKCRKEVKEPVLEAGKQIDQAAKDFTKDLEVQKFRITALISDHAREQEKLRQEAIRKQQEADAELQRLAKIEQDKLEAAEKAALAAEQALLDAMTKKEQAKATKLLEEARAKEAAAKQATALADAAEKVEDNATMAVLAAAAPKGVKPVLDYEVLDLVTLYRTHPHLVELAPRRAKILQELKNLQDDNLPVEISGLKIIEKFTVSSR